MIDNRQGLVTKVLTIQTEKSHITIAHFTVRLKANTAQH